MVKASTKKERVLGTKLACSTACFRHASIDVVLQEIRNIGFEAIDLTLIPGICDHFDAARQPAIERQDFVALIRNSGLLVPTVTAAPGDFTSASHFEFVIQSATAHLKLAAQLASEALNVICTVSPALPGQLCPEILAESKTLKQIARTAAQFALNVNVPAPSGGGLRLLDRIQEDNVRLLVNVSRSSAALTSPAETVRTLAGRIGHVRVTECADVDLRALIEALARVGYDGYCALELDVNTDGREATQAVSQAFRLMRV